VVVVGNIKTVRTILARNITAFKMMVTRGERIMKITPQTTPIRGDGTTAEARTRVPK
jgi:hypothetical protein